MKITSVTDIGVKRKDNQDNYWSAVLDIDGKEAGVICLCDGMGGLKNGALASRVVVSGVREFFSKSIDFSELEEVLRELNREICLNLSKEGKLGTTCTIVFCYEGVYRVLHIGDSRCYLARGGNVRVLTEDHTVIEKYRKEGRELSDKLARKYKSVLTRCMGAVENVRFDYLEGTYEEGDVFLLCSDGFWHYLDDESFFNGDLDRLDSMVDKCIRNGETDNISVGVLSI